MKKYNLIILSLFLSTFLNAEYIDSPKYQYALDESISIEVKELLSSNAYWMGVYPKSSGNNWTNVVSWPLTSIRNGLVNVEGINTAGAYEARLFYANSYSLIDTVAFDIRPSATNDCGTPWYTASLTHYESYPTTNSECNNFNGCQWRGKFYGLEGVKSESWVRNHNIVAVHLKDWGWLGNRELRIRQGSREILVKAYDACSDEDDTVNGSACTDNLGNNNFLIDMEKYTKARFGSGSGDVKFQVCY